MPSTPSRPPTTPGQLGAHDEAIAVLDEARDQTERCGDHIRLARVYNNLGFER